MQHALPSTSHLEGKKISIIVIPDAIPTSSYCFLSQLSSTKNIFTIFSLTIDFFISLLLILSFNMWVFSSNDTASFKIKKNLNVIGPLAGRFVVNYQITVK